MVGGGVGDGLNEGGENGDGGIGGGGDGNGCNGGVIDGANKSSDVNKNGDRNIKEKLERGNAEWNNENKHATKAFEGKGGINGEGEKLKIIFSSFKGKNTEKKLPKHVVRAKKKKESYYKNNTKTISLSSSSSSSSEEHECDGEEKREEGDGSLDTESFGRSLKMLEKTLKQCRRQLEKHKKPSRKPLSSAPQQMVVKPLVCKHSTPQPFSSSSIAPLLVTSLATNQPTDQNTTTHDLTTQASTTQESTTQDSTTQNPTTQNFTTQSSVDPSSDPSKKQNQRSLFGPPNTTSSTLPSSALKTEKVGCVCVRNKK